MPSRLLLLRHGQSTWNAEGRWQGWSDPPLSDQGRAQAAEAGRRLSGMHLAGLNLTGVVASDLDRARTTAAIVAETLGLGPVLVDRGLREYDVGDWEGLTRPEIESGWPDQLAAWREGRLLATPGGETRSAFLERIGAALARAAATTLLGDSPVVVTHGGVMRAAEQVSGSERTPVIDNLGARWFLVDEVGRIRAGDPVILLSPSGRTASTSL